MTELYNSYKIYSRLGKFIKDFYFSHETVGTEIFPSIDTSLIKMFCSGEGISMEQFIQYIQRISLSSIHWQYSVTEMLGLIGIQLFSASKMENSNGLSSGNYRDRICSKAILNIDVNDWQTWAQSNQDNLWAKYYSWCAIHGFILVNKCKPFEGKDRYVQYPKVHSSNTLNREDLKRIAALFVQKGLSPTEDLSEKEFWRLIGKYHNESYYSNRAKRILEEDRPLANKQIFQYYLTWDGEYVDPYSNKLKKEDAQFQLFLYHNLDGWSIDVYNNITNTIDKQIPLEGFKYDLHIKSYHVLSKRDCLLFKPTDEYDNYWEECRYLTNKEDVGMALFYRYSAFKKYQSKDVVGAFDNYVLVKIDSNNYPQLYSEDRPYSLYGGMKVLPNTYILGAPPVLILHQSISFWIDGAKQEGKKGQIILHLTEGKHVLSIRGYKPIIINMMQVSPIVHAWGDNKKWEIKRSTDNPLWIASTDNGNILGLDYEMFSSYRFKTPEKSKLSEWCRNIVFKKKSNFPKF